MLIFGLWGLHRGVQVEWKTRVEEPRALGPSDFVVGYLCGVKKSFPFLRDGCLFCNTCCVILSHHAVMGNELDYEYSKRFHKCS